LIDEGRWEELVSDLLVQHYDPTYARSQAAHREKHAPMVEKLEIADWCHFPTAGIPAPCVARPGKARQWLCDRNICFCAGIMRRSTKQSRQWRVVSSTLRATVLPMEQSVQRQGYLKLRRRARMNACRDLHALFTVPCRQLLRHRLALLRFEPGPSRSLPPGHGSARVRHPAPPLPFRSPGGARFAGRAGGPLAGARGA